MLQIELDQSSTLKLISQLYPTEELLLCLDQRASSS